MRNQRLLHIIIFIFLVLSSLSFFKLSLLGSFSKLFELGGIVVIITFICLHFVYGVSLRKKQLSFSTIILFFLMSSIISMFAAYAFHGQDFKITIWEQRALYFYLFYFLLHYLRIEKEWIEKFFIYIAIIIGFLHIFQFISYPKLFFDVTIFKDRGTIRVFLPGQSYLIIAFFMIIQDILEKFKVQKLYLALFIFSIFIIRGGRTVLFLVFLGVILILLLSNKIKSKTLIGVLIISSFVPVFFLFQDIFIELLNATKETRQAGDENIRLKAAKYFLLDFFPNTFSYFTGNGAPNSRSAYGRIFVNLMENQKYFTSDIGLIGNYVKYGALFIIAVLSSFFVAFKKLNNNLLYIKVMLILTLVSILAGGGFEKSDFIVFITTIFYIIDCSYNSKRGIVQKEKY